MKENLLNLRDDNGVWQQHFYDDLFELSEELSERNIRVDDTVVLSPDVYLGSGVLLGEGVHVGRGTVIDKDSRIMPHSKIGRDSDIGKNCYIGSECRVGDRVIVGTSVIIGQGCAIGGDSCIRRRASLPPDSVVGTNCMVHPDVGRHPNLYFKIGFQEITYCGNGEINVSGAQSPISAWLSQPRLESGQQSESDTHAYAVQMAVKVIQSLVQ